MSDLSTMERRYIQDFIVRVRQSGYEEIRLEKRFDWPSGIGLSVYRMNQYRQVRFVYPVALSVVLYANNRGNSRGIGLRLILADGTHERLQGKMCRVGDVRINREALMQFLDECIKDMMSIIPVQLKDKSKVA